MSGIIIVTSVSLVLSIVISLVYYYINKENVVIKEIEAMLPGFNCNVCGFGSCKGMAEQALNNPDELIKCRFLKENQILEIKEYITGLKEN